jgi:hypothetical protein
MRLSPRVATAFRLVTRLPVAKRDLKLLQAITRLQRLDAVIIA